MSSVLAIDPGTSQSAFCYFNPNANPPSLSAGILPNEEMIELIRKFSGVELAIERVASYGMPVGVEVFQTVHWSGRFQQAHLGVTRLIFRRDVKLHLCKSPKANDASIRQRLIDLYGAPGTKKAPGFTYGLKSDTWQAFALAVTAIENPELGKQSGDQSQALS